MTDKVWIKLINSADDPNDPNSTDPNKTNWKRARGWDGTSWSDASVPYWFIFDGGNKGKYENGLYQITKDGAEYTFKMARRGDNGAAIVIRQAIVCPADNPPAQSGLYSYTPPPDEWSVELDNNGPDWVISDHDSNNDAHHLYLWVQFKRGHPIIAIDPMIYNRGGRG